MELRYAGLAIALGLVFSGCLQAPTPSPPPVEPLDWPPRYCVEIVCLVDPEHPNAATARELYGIERITQGGGSGVCCNMDLDGDWFVFQRARDIDDTVGKRPAEDVYAYNFATDELIAVDAGNQTHAYRPFIHDGVVVYGRDDGEYRGIMAWDTETRTHTRVETGLVAGDHMWRWDGQWIIFASRGNQDPELNGYHAFHLETGQRVFLERSPNSDLPHIYGRMQGLDTWNGYVYMLVNTEPGHARSQEIWEVHLDSGEKRFWSFPGGGAGHIYAGGEDYLTLWVDSQLFILHNETGDFESLEDIRGRCSTSPIVEGWLVARCTGLVEDPWEIALQARGVWAVHLPTREVIRITDERIHANNPITDGKIAILHVHLGAGTEPDILQREPGGSADYFWYPLPEISA